MKDAHRQFIRDLKASCLIGDSESIGLVLLEWIDWPVVTSNQPVPDSFLEQIIIPAGRLLAGSSLEDEQLYEFQKEDLAAWRLLAAAAVSFRWGQQPRKGLAGLDIFSRDQRSDVRSGFARTLVLAGLHQERIQEEIVPWLEAASPRQRETALRVLTGMEELSPASMKQITAMNNEDHPDVRAALVDLLAAAVRRRKETWVADLLKHWEHDPASHPWLIEKTSRLVQNERDGRGDE
jgi:hypothetical protein